MAPKHPLPHPGGASGERLAPGASSIGSSAPTGADTTPLPGQKVPPGRRQGRVGRAVGLRRAGVRPGGRGVGGPVSYTGLVLSQGNPGRNSRVAPPGRVNDGTELPRMQTAVSGVRGSPPRAPPGADARRPTPLGKCDALKERSRFCDQALVLRRRYRAVDEP